MGKSSRLRADDYRTVLRLTHDCRDLGDSPAAWGALLASNVGRLTGAVIVTVSETAPAAGGYAFRGGADWGWGNGLDLDLLGALQSAHDWEMRFHPQIDAYLARPEAADGSALARGDLVGDEDWYQSPYFRDVHDPLRFGHNIVSFLTPPDSPGVCLSINLCRGASERRDFTPRLKALVREVNAAVAPLLGGPLARFDEPSASDLPSRVREVLQCLLEGDGDKQVAARLGVSRYTVNEYTKRIYQHFGVQGRAELLARWVRRGWGSGRPQT
jgi:DNA-binding CsgD family transcriptional regulator